MGRHRKDITGIKSGTLTAIRPILEKDGTESFFWLCSCDCGCDTTKIVNKRRFAPVYGPLNCRIGKSCIVGMKSGSLTAIKRISKGRIPSLDRWLCSCNCGCGSTKIVTATRIIRKSKRFWHKRHKHMASCQVGDRHGWLTLIKKAPDKIIQGKKRPCWYCNCDCGKKSVVKAEIHLRARKKDRWTVQTCGCGTGISSALWSSGLFLTGIPVKERKQLMELCRLQAGIKKIYRETIRIV